MSSIMICRAFFVWCLFPAIVCVQGRPRNVDGKLMIQSPEASVQTDPSAVETESGLEKESDGRLENGGGGQGELEVNVKGQTEPGSQADFAEEHPPGYNAPTDPFPTRQDQALASKAETMSKSFNKGFRSLSNNQIDTEENGLSDSDENSKLIASLKDSDRREQNSPPSTSGLLVYKPVDLSDNDTADKSESKNQKQLGIPGITVQSETKSQKALLWQKEGDLNPEERDEKDLTDDNGVMKMKAKVRDTAKRKELFVSRPGRKNDISDPDRAPNISKLEPSVENGVHSVHIVPAMQAPVGLTGRQSEDRGTDNDNEADATKDDCEINKLRCSPFFASPCEKLNPHDGPQYGGHCRIRRRTAEKKWKPCGGLWTPQNRSACFCSNHAAVCCANLNAIPDLSINNNKTVLYLNFTSNNLTVLDKDLLNNVTQVKWLILNRNNISIVCKDSLENMRHLERFELAYNQFHTKLDPWNFTEAVNRVHSLQVLDLNFTEFARARRTEVGITWLIRHLELPRLKQFFVDGGRKTRFYLSDLDPIRLPKLCKFSIKSHFVERVYCCSIRSRNDSLDDEDEEEQMDNSDYPYIDDTIHEFSCISSESRHEAYCQHFQLPSMKLLNFANNSLVYVPHFCRNGSKMDKNESVVPSLTHLLLAINAVINPRRYQFQCMDNLLFLGLTGNPLKRIESNVFQNLIKLERVDLRFTNVMQVESHAFNHSTLKAVTIKSSNWFVDQHHEGCCISPDLFRGSALEEADLSYNVFRYADKNTTHFFLYPLRTVKTLQIAEVGFFKIPKVILDEFTNLEVLDFKANQLSQIPENGLRNLTNLKRLDLSNNLIANPREEVVHELVVERNVRVNLESNPFSCTCDLLPFLDLYKVRRDTRRPKSASPLLSALSNHSAPKGLLEGKDYRCYAPLPLVNRSLQHVDLTIHNCLLTIYQEIIIYVVCLLFIFFLLVYALLYKYRWQVRFWLYTLHVRLNRMQNAAAPGGGGGGAGGGGGGHRPMYRPRFNAFVSYCKKDSHFVINKVLPTLERNSRLPLCIHERDFIPGRYISQNVVERMEESRQVLLVLSNAFLEDDWCRFELFVAQKYGLVYRQIPIVVLRLEQLRVDLMDAHVITLLHASPEITWPGNQEGAQVQASFWNRLGQTLGTPRAGQVPMNPRARVSSESGPGAAARTGGGRVRQC